MHKKRIYIIILCIFILSCQSIKNYHKELIDKSLVCGIPALIGDLAGNAIGAPFLLITAPAGYLLFPAKYSDNKNNSEKYDLNQKERDDFILKPIHFTSHTFGIIIGTPFYPLGLIFPREDLN